MYGLQEHEMRFYCLFKKVYFSLLATSDFFCRHAYAYAHMRIIRHESDMAAYAWPSLVDILSANRPLIRPVELHLQGSVSNRGQTLCQNNR